MKQGKLEPNPSEAASLGSDENTKELDTIADRLNTTIYDFLLKLPGLTTRNVYKVMTKVKNLKELIKFNLVIGKREFFGNNSSLEIHSILLFQNELTELLGSEANAKMFWEIVHIAHKHVEVNPHENKQFASKFKRGRRP